MGLEGAELTNKLQLLDTSTKPLPSAVRPGWCVGKGCTEQPGDRQAVV